MGNYDSQTQLFKALMHPVRLAILDVLRDGEECVCHMEATLGYRQAYISQHLMVLREAGLVGDRREGLNIFYRVMRPEIYALLEAVRQMLGVLDSDPVPDPVASCPCPHCSMEREALQPEGRTILSE
jgi:DNA-binding transcriptional ArsR family regulator